MLKHNLVHSRDMMIGEYLIFFLFAGGMAGLLMWLKSHGVQRYRIHSTMVGPVTTAREFVNSCRSLFIYNGLQIVMRMVILAFGFVLTFDARPPLWQVLLSFPLVIVLHDAYFYWTHRLFHLRWAFKLSHWEHHKAKQPTVFTAFRFSVIEATVQGLYPILYVLLFPCNYATLVFFYVVMILHDVMIHAGVDVFPPFLVTGRFRLLCGTVHHDMHHQLGRTNYGLYLRFWDLVMKTEHPEFERVYDYVRSPQNDGDAYRRLLSRRPARADIAAAPPAAEPAVVS